MSKRDGTLCFCAASSVPEQKTPLRRSPQRCDMLYQRSSQQTGTIQPKVSSILPHWMPVIVS